MSETFIQSFTHLKDKPNADRALHMLQKMASLVKPIMRKHGWVLPVLAEFYPDNPSLLGLNVNMGQQILVRLRHAHSPASFHDQEDVVQTLLHELTHNVYGPHDDKFYKFLSGLQDEYDALQRSGYAGEGFFSKGQRLGTNVSHDLPPHLARVKALEAAEKRRNTSRVLGSGGRLGGGRIDTKGKTPGELAAEAAERRARDEKSCGSQAGSELARIEAEKAAREGVKNQVINLTLDDYSDSDSVVIVEDVPRPVAGPSSSSAAFKPNRRATAPNFNGPGSASKLKATPDRSNSAGSQNSRARLPPTEWACQMCTLLNNAFALQCNVCLTKRPQDVNEGWTCLTCGEGGMEHQFWSCRFCGTIKAES